MHECSVVLSEFVILCVHMFLLHKLFADRAPQESAGDEFEDGEVDPETDGGGRSDQTSGGNPKDAQDRCAGTSIKAKLEWVLLSLTKINI